MCKRGKIVIVGGTSGIGFEAGQYLKQRGYSVVLVGRRSIEISGIESYCVDVRSEESVAELFKCLLKINDNIKGLIYAAGVTTSQKNIEYFNLSIWNNIISTNVTGILLILKYSYPILKKNNGRVVIVNSLAARRYSEFSGVEYTISKSALSGLVRQLAIEWAPDNVLINSVYPGMTLTPMLEKNVEKKHLRMIEEKIPLRRIAKPQEIARAIEFLISQNNTYITGSGIDICGGQYLNG